MALYLVKQSPFTTKSLESCLSIIDPHIDALLLIQDGVYATLLKTSWCTRSQQPSIYALTDDLRSRGILTRCPAHIKTIDYDEFVRLTETQSTIISWA